MEKDFIVAQAEQDQQWMALDDWYGRPESSAELMDLFEVLDMGKPQLIKKMDKHGLECVRVLALHTLRELMLRQQAAKERSIQGE